MSSDRSAHEYRAIRRIQQACLNCRRKKARCSGERPSCSYCRRLSQECQYWDYNAAKQGSAPSQSATSQRENMNNNNDLLARVAAIESKLTDLIDTLNTSLPIIMNQTKLHTPSNIEDTQRLTTSGGAANTDPLSEAPKSYKELPPPDILNSLVDLYFLRCYNQPYSFFHEQTFRQRLADGLLPEYLTFAVIASSLRFFNDPYYGTEQQVAVTAYASQSWKHIVVNYFATETDPDISICQAITLLSIIDFTAGRRHPAWMKIGLSVRIAQDLHLMMEPDPNLSYADQEERRRVFWSIYVLDKLCSCGRASPAAIRDSHCRLQLPCDEATFRMGNWKKTQTLQQAFTYSETATERLGHLALVILVASTLSRCAQYCIYEDNKSEPRLSPWDSKSEFSEIYSMLLHFETDCEMGSKTSDVIAQGCMQDGVIDTQIAGPLIFARALFHVCQCILHHPFLLYQQSKLSGGKGPASFLARALQTCREHAFSLSNLLKDANTAGCPVFFSFMGYCTMIAGTVHIMFLNDPDILTSRQASDCLHADLAFIEELARYWKSGKFMSAVLQYLSANSSRYSTFITTGLQPQNLDSSDLGILQSCFDYTSMCQPANLNPSQDDFGGTSAGWNSMIMFGSSDAPDFGDHNFPVMPSYEGEPISYNSGMFSGMTPISQLLGDSSMPLDG